MMKSENRTEGAAKVAVGKVESTFGEALDDDRMRIRGAARQVEGHVQEVTGSVQDVLGQVRSAASRVSDTYRRAGDTVDDLARKVEERPLIAVAAAAAIGLLVGLLIAGRGPKIVYVRPRD